MNKNPKIVVFKLKELIYTGIFILLGILLIILFVWMFRSGKSKDTAASVIPESSISTSSLGTGYSVSNIPSVEETHTSEKTIQNDTDKKYSAGVYTSSLLLNNSTLEIEVCVSPEQITSVSIKNMDEAVKTMYPLIENSVKDLEHQVIRSQSLNNITYPEDCKYTYLILIDAVTQALSKALKP